MVILAKSKKLRKAVKPIEPAKGKATPAGTGTKAKQIRAVQFSLGFERAHPCVWEYFRNQGILFAQVSAVKAQARVQLIEEGMKVLVYAPKSQGGHGVLGIGTVTSPIRKFEEGGKFLNDPVGRRLREAMRNIYSDPNNEPIKSKRCFKRHVRDHMESGKLESNGLETTQWQFSQRWTSDKSWAEHRTDTDASLVYIRVHWEATVPYENGFFYLNWKALRLPDFRFAQLASISPRKLLYGHWNAIRNELVNVGKAAGRSGAPCLAIEDKPYNGDVRSSDDVVDLESAPPPSKVLKRPSSVAASTSSPVPVTFPGRSGVGSDFAPQSMSEMLTALGLAKYIQKFRDEEIDFAALKLLRDEDMETLGLPMGPWCKLKRIASCLPP